MRRAACTSVLLVLALAAGCAAAEDRPPRPQVDVTTYGALPDDGVDDTEAIRAALAALPSGERLWFPAGVYEHSNVLSVDTADVELAGPDATLLATQESGSALQVLADDVWITGLTLDVAGTTQRWSEPEQQRLWISGTRGTVVEEVRVAGSAAAGVFLDGAADFTLRDVRVSDTRADGIHVTGGSHDGLIDHPVVARTGDDGVAVVSYDSDRAETTDIRIESPQVLGTTWGRGISVVGGSRITYSDVLVEDTDAAGVYIASEGDPYFTRATRDVVVDGGTVRRANRNGDIDHGAVLVYLGRPELPMSGVEIADLEVVDTRASASQDVGVVGEGGAEPQGLTFRGLTFEGGPTATYGGNVTGYSVE